MTVRVPVALVLLAALLAACATGGAGGAPGPALPDGPLPSAALMPYVDVSGDAPPDLAAVGAETGAHDYVFAFALAGDGLCRPRWGGVLPVDAPAVVAQAQRVRAAGGGVTAATGGAAGPYLETACTTPEDLAGAYGSVLDAVGSSSLDVDVEADVPVDRVVPALHRVQHDRGTAITVTLPVSGADAALTPAAMTLLRALAAAGVAVRVNVMVMNFPDEGDWGAAMRSAVDSTTRRLGEVWPGADPAALNRRVGVTVMIGRNDQGMVTTLRDATDVARDARDRGLGAVGMWSVARDDACPDETVARPDCSGVAQTPFDFLRALRTTFVP